MERQFDHQIDKLKTKIIKMCSLVDEQVQFAVQALREENEELANLVIERDKKVDKFDVKIDKICQKIIALNQPVAMDLRLIMSAITINTNLERIGDIAVNIAETFLRMKKKPSFIDDTKFNEMAQVVQEMIRHSIDAFIEHSLDMAHKVIEMDDKLDQLDKENYDIMINIIKQTPENVEPGVSLLLISRHLERLGDHATNIAEDVYFIVEAQLIKHKYEKFFFKDIHEEEDDE